MPLALFSIVGLLTGYFAAPVYHELRKTRVEAEREGRDTTVDPDVILRPSYKSVSLRSTAVSLLSAVLTSAAFSLLYLLLQPSASLAGALIVFLPCAVFLSLIDHIILRLPFPIVFLAAGWIALVAIASALLTSEENRIVPMFAGGVTYFSFFFLVFLVSSGKMGFGDVTLAVPLGFLLGFSTDGALDAVSLTLKAMLLGSVTMLALVAVTALRSRVKNENSEGRNYTPYGPCLIAGAVLALLL